MTIKRLGDDMYRITDNEIATVQNVTGLSRLEAILALQKNKGSVPMTIAAIPNMMRVIEKEAKECMR